MGVRLQLHNVVLNQLPWKEGVPVKGGPRREFAEGRGSLEAALGLRGIEGVLVCGCQT